MRQKATHLVNLKAYLWSKLWSNSHQNGTMPGYLITVSAQKQGLYGRSKPTIPLEGKSRAAESKGISPTLRSMTTCPDDIATPEQVEDIIRMINDIGIPVSEEAPDEDSLLMGDTTPADDAAAEEAAAALASVESDVGRTTDPVRMYMREMGTVELLTREGEIVIAKRIEEGIREVMAAIAYYPGAVQALSTPTKKPVLMKNIIALAI
jgi:hypothetical protein